MELEDVIFVDVLRLGRDGDGVAQQREAGQRVVILQDRNIFNSALFSNQSETGSRPNLQLVPLRLSPDATCRRRG